MSKFIPARASAVLLDPPWVEIPRLPADRALPAFLSATRPSISMGKDNKSYKRSSETYFYVDFK